MRVHRLWTAPLSYLVRDMTLDDFGHRGRTQPRQYIENIQVEVLKILTETLGIHRED
jgi:hypothetical protein